MEIARLSNYASARVPDCRCRHKRRDNLLEPLELRILLATDFAPFSLVGRAATLSITSGTGVYANSGNALFAVSSASPRYYLLGLTPAVADSYGTYTYSRNSGTVATIVAHDTVFGLTSTDTLAFTSASSGTFAVFSVGGTQTGIFTIVATPAGIAPASVLNDRIHFQISAGHGAFATNGNYTIAATPVGNTYTLAGSPGIPNSSGTYTYTKTTTATALLSAQDSLLGPLMEELSFNTTTSGSFLVGNSATDSWQIGTFSLTPAINRPPIGNIDLASTFTLGGWAYDPDIPASSIRVNLVLDGSTVLTTLASTPRTDLIRTLGSANHGFSFGLSSLPPGIHSLAAYAVDNTGLTVSFLGTHIIDTNLLPMGHVDILTNTNLAGWAVDPNDVSRPLQIRYDIDNNAPTFITASANRADLSSLYSNTAHGFAITFPQLPAGPHTVTVYAVDNDDRALIPLASKTIVDAPTPATTGPHLPRGSLDIATSNRIAGWAYDADGAGQPVSVRVDIDGVTGTPSLANSPRSDLVRFFGAAQFGFDLQNLNLSAGPHRIDVYALDNPSNIPVLLVSRIINDALNFGAATQFYYGAVSGWAYAQAADNHQATIRIDADGLTGALLTANLPAPSVAAALHGPNFGFTFTPHLTSGLHHVSVYLLDPITDSLLLVHTGLIHVPA